MAQIWFNNIHKEVIINILKIANKLIDAAKVKQTIYILLFVKLTLYYNIMNICY